MTSATPLSYPRICWVRRARVAASAVGRASASSKPLVWSDCVPPSDGGERLDGDAHHVVQWLLRLQGDAAGLGVEAEPRRLVVGPEPRPDETGPEAPRRAELGRLLEEVVVRGEEEREARTEAVDRQAGRDPDPHVLQGVGEGEGDLLRRGGARLAHVVAADRDRVDVHPALGRRTGRCRRSGGGRARADRCRCRGRCIP